MNNQYQLLDDDQPETEEWKGVPFQAPGQEPVIENDSNTPIDAIKAGARVGGGVAKKAFSLFAGIPGLAIQGAKYLSEQLPDLPDFLKKEPSELEKQGKDFIEQVWTPNEWENYIDSLTEGSLQPQTENERLQQDIGTNLLASGIFRMSAPLVQKIVTPIAGSLSKELSENLGGDDKTSGYIQFGTELLSDLLQMSDGKSVSGKLYKEADKLAQGKKVYVGGTDPFAATRKEVNRGAMTASKERANKIIKSYDKKSKGGAIDVEELTQFNKDINEFLDEIGSFDVGPVEKANTERLLKDAKKDLSTLIQGYGKSDPEFLEKWQAANRSHAAYQQSNVISKFYQKNVGGKAKSLLAKSLFGVGGVGATAGLAYTSPAALATGVGLSLASTPLYMGGKLLYRVVQSPELRKHYTEALQAAMKNNTPQFIKSFEKLDKEALKLEKEESKQAPYKLLD